MTLFCLPKVPLSFFRNNHIGYHILCILITHLRNLWNKITNNILANASLIKKEKIKENNFLKKEKKREIKKKGSTKIKNKKEKR